MSTRQLCVFFFSLIVSYRVILYYEHYWPTQSFCDTFFKDLHAQSNIAMLSVC